MDKWPPTLAYIVEWLENKLPERLGAMVLFPVIVVLYIIYDGE